MTVTSIRSDLELAIEKQDIALVAEVEGQPVGVAWCIERGMFGADAYLKRFGVDPSLSGRSIGTALLNALEARARESGALFLTLLVGSENARAERFYIRNGYELRGVLPDFAVVGIEERMYRKRLSPLSY